MNHFPSRPAASGDGVSRFAALLVAATLLALAFLGFTATAGQAAAAPSGSFSMTLGYGPSGKALKKAGVRISAVSPSTQQNLSGKRVRVTSALLSAGSATELSLRGGVRFTRGKRNVVARKVIVNTDKGRIIATVGGKRIALFLSSLNPQVSESTGDLIISGAKLRLTAGSAKLIRTKLRIKRLPPSQVGGLGGNVSFPLEDPYLTQCGVAATEKAIGSLPEATPLPVLSNAKDLVGPGSLSWGFKASFRNYIIFGASGSLQAVAPATVQSGVPVAAGFDFPVEGGQYAANDPIDTSDDQAVIPGTGTALLCATGHNFRVAVSNPTVVIDGENSRIVADIDTNLSGVWTPTQRVDLAELDLAGATPFFNRSGSEVSWGELPATFTEAGANAICGTGEQTACSYVAGTEMDPIDVSVKTAYDTTDLTALTTFVETELPFPIPDASQGGCTVPSANPPTIDADNTKSWPEVPSSPLPEPQLASSGPADSGLIEWGVRRGLRGTVNATGEFNLLGATASDNYFGFGGDGTRSMSNTALNPPKYFRWPAAGESVTYAANGPGQADDRAVIRGTGRVAICQTDARQAYGLIISNPTVVIDGTNSRITADVATRYRLSWMRGRIDLATIDLEAATLSEVVNDGQRQLSWSFAPAGPVAPEPEPREVTGPVSLTKSGEALLNVLDPRYVEGFGGMDAMILRIKVPE